MKNFKKIILAVILIVLFLALCAGGYLFFVKNKKHEPVISVSQENKIDLLNEINSYQAKYFEIIERHNALLNLQGDVAAMKDLNELKLLFLEVKKRINSNNEFLAEYEKINNKYKINKGNTTVEINDFAKEKYDAFDKLLNDTYKEVKSNISEYDFEQLKLSQRAWLNEVEAYNKVFEAQEFGTIGTLVKFDYETNMRCFRTLLLMLYLKDSKKAVLRDFIGNWHEIVAGRIYVDIENKKDKILVKKGGANSAYSHSETVYDCRFDENEEALICNSAKRTDQFLSCKGISSDENLEEFLKCVEENPKLEKDDYKTYTEKKMNIIKIKKGNSLHNIVDDNEYLSGEMKSKAHKDYENMGLYFADDIETVYYKQK